MIIRTSRSLSSHPRAPSDFRPRCPRACHPRSRHPQLPLLLLCLALVVALPRYVGARLSPYAHNSSLPLPLPRSIQGVRVPRRLPPTRRHRPRDARRARRHLRKVRILFPRKTPTAAVRAHRSIRTHFRISLCGRLRALIVDAAPAHKGSRAGASGCTRAPGRLHVRRGRVPRVGAGASPVRGLSERKSIAGS